jgi:hypothetical protein
VEGGDVLGHAVILEHVQQRRLPRIVEAQEEELPGLLPKTCK